jgi:hypothetical protein
MTITYAGVPIQPPSDADALATRFWHGHRIDQFDHQGYFTSALAHLPIPYPPKREAPRIGVLSWPVGADRWATCHLLATGAQISAIRAAIGTVPESKPLVLSDGAGGAITANMYALPHDPVSQRADDKEYYLLTLVDERWWWWQAGATAVPDLSSWESLLTSLLASVDVDSPTIETPNFAYGYPNVDRWGVAGEVPVMIEAVCRQIGMRLVRKLNGDVEIVNYTQSKTADDARWLTIRDHVLAGGRIAGQDVARAAPESLDVKFFDGTSENVTLASLVIADYAGIAGVPGKKGLYTSDLYVGAGLVEKAGTAQAAANDYYNWYLSPTHCTLRRFHAVDPTGLDDVLEWVHHQNGLVTRILRPQWSDRNLYGSRPSNECPLAGMVPQGNGPQVSVDDTWVDLVDPLFSGELQYTQFVLPASGTYLLSGKVVFAGSLIPDDLDPDHKNVGYLMARVRNADSGLIYDTSEVAVSVFGNYTGDVNTDTTTIETRSFTVIVGGVAGERIRLQGYRAAPLTTFDWHEATIGARVVGEADGFVESVHPVFTYLLICPSAEEAGAGSGSVCTSINGWGGPGPYCVFDSELGRCVAVILTEAQRCNPNVEICYGPYTSLAAAEAACPQDGGSGTGSAAFLCCDGAPAPTAGTVTIPANACGLNAGTHSLSVSGGAPGSVLATFSQVTPEDPTNGGGGFLQCTELVEGGWWSQVTPYDPSTGTSYPAVGGIIVGAACGESSVTVQVSYTITAPCFTTLILTWTLTW